MTASKRITDLVRLPQPTLAPGGLLDEPTPIDALAAGFLVDLGEQLVGNADEDLGHGYMDVCQILQGC